MGDDGLRDLIVGDLRFWDGMLSGLQRFGLRQVRRDWGRERLGLLILRLRAVDVFGKTQTVAGMEVFVAWTLAANVLGAHTLDQEACN